MKVVLSPSEGSVRDGVTHHVAENATHFRQLSRRLLNTQLDATASEFLRSDHVYNIGDHDAYVYLIEHGQVKVQIVTATGKRCLLSIHAAGDMFGETAMLGIERPDAAIALARSVVRRIPVGQFRAALKSHGLEDAFLRHLSLRVLNQQKVIADMVTMTSELRLATRLLDLAALFGSPRRQGIVHIIIRLTHEDLAEMIGTTRTRIGQFLAGFRRAGLIQMSNHSHLLIDEARLAGWIAREACLPRRTSPNAQF